MALISDDKQKYLGNAVPLHSEGRVRSNHIATNTSVVLRTCTRNIVRCIYVRSTAARALVLE